MRDHYTLGRFVPRTVAAAAAPPPPRLGSRVLAFGLAFGFWLLSFASFLLFFFFCVLVRLCFGFSALARLCAWLLTFGFPVPAPAVRLCAWLSAFALALGFWLLLVWRFSSLHL